MFNKTLFVDIVRYSSALLCNAKIGGEKGQTLFRIVRCIRVMLGGVQFQRFADLDVWGRPM